MPDGETRRGKGDYHHGDLRRALVDAGRDLLEREGLEQLTLRGAARAAGVSQSAPYHHFADKSALLSAIATEGFHDFAEAMRARIAEAKAPEDRLTAAGVAYVVFASEHPAIFKLMFSADGWSEDEARVAAGAEAYAVLESAVRDTGRGEGAPEAGFAALSSWSLVHGLAKLTVELGVSPERYGCASVEELAENVLDNSFIAGTRRG